MRHHIGGGRRSDHRERREPVEDEDTELVLAFGGA